MQDEMYQKLFELETTQEALQATAEYLAGKMRPFLEVNERVLICFPDTGAKSLGAIFKEAVLLCGACPIMWGPDYRWKELLRRAFETHANTLIGHPVVLLGLMKLARATSTPLYIYDLVMGGCPYGRWMVDGLKKGLDCRIWGCYAIRSGPVVTGFTCAQEAGFHVREDIVSVVLSDENGDELTDNHRGRLHYVSKKNPDLVYEPDETALLHRQPCVCGCESPRIYDIIFTGQTDPAKVVMDEQFLAWSSILDYHAVRTESGISLELVVFPGESLPKLPSCARLKVRPWNPEEDIPFYIRDNFIKIPEKVW